MSWLLLVILIQLDCARLREICQNPTVGYRRPEWCHADLEEWCPLADAGLTVVGETPPVEPVCPEGTILTCRGMDRMGRSWGCDTCAKLAPPEPPPVANQPQPEPKTGPKDRLEVRCSPRQGLNGYVAQVFMRIERPDKLYCPEITVQWPDGTRSGPRQADCDPLEEGEEAESWSGGELWPDGLRFRVTGRMTVVVRAKAGKTERREECEVEGF